MSGGDDRTAKAFLSAASSGSSVIEQPMLDQKAVAELEVWSLGSFGSANDGHCEAAERKERNDFIAGDKPTAEEELEPENLKPTASRFDPDDLRRWESPPRRAVCPRAHLVRLAPCEVLMTTRKTGSSRWWRSTTFSERSHTAWMCPSVYRTSTDDHRRAGPLRHPHEDVMMIGELERQVRIPQVRRSRMRTVTAASRDEPIERYGRAVTGDTNVIARRRAALARRLAGDPEPAACNAPTMAAATWRACARALSVAFA